MADTYKVAVATSDGKNVDSHFGHVSSFLILEVDGESGHFEDIEDRSVAAACSAGERGGVSCGGRNGVGEGKSAMDAIAEILEDVDYVLTARIGPHAIRALAKYNITAYDIVLPIDEAVKKISEFRQKIAERRIKVKL